ncbi:NUDIX domain-containing protein [Pilimelia terevasa]|uniref:NUDIX domain-containing protein n=1 Tax=Pilimelia terevasa TaxID=53372 RepID=UPI001E40EE35|nr:NUDIX hydrolase [Pilimelia terevasa]
MTSSPAADYTATLARKRAAAAVLFHDARGRVLIVEPTYKDYWEIPGGAVNADESPRDAAAREIKEELGLVVRPGRLLAVDWVPPREGRTEGLMFVFDGGTLTAAAAAAVKLPADELRSWRWCSRQEAAERLSPLLARRAAAAWEAALAGSTVYLENGYA